MPAQLLLVDDHQIVLDSLRLLTASIPDIELVATLNDSRDVLTFVQQHPIDIVVCDLNMPHVSGVDLCLQLRHSYPLVKVLLLTMAEDAQSIREAVQAGAAGYILKRTGRDELEQAVKTLLAGKKYFSQEIIHGLTSLSVSPSDEVNPFVALTDREIDVLKLIAEEHSTAGIAEQLCISPATVETHRRHLMQKLGVKSVVGMVKFAMKHGLVA